MDNDQPPPVVPVDEAESPTASTSKNPYTSSPPPSSPPRDYTSTSESAPINIDADINRSTLKLILETAGETLLYLCYAVGVWLVAWLIRQGSTYPFRALSFMLRWLGWAIERSLYWVAWLAGWLSWIAGGLLIAFFLILCIAYAGIVYEPSFRRASERHPTAYKVVLQGVIHSPLLLALRYLPRWISYPVITLAALRLVAVALGLELPLARRKLGTSPIPAQVRTESERSKEEREPEQWARKMQEEMLRESLARRARKAAESGLVVEEDADP